MANRCDVSFPGATVHVRQAWTAASVRERVRELLELRADALPASAGARVLIKPNLNNDLVALTGNSTDLRVLAALVEALLERGYHRITLADGPNVGVERRGIDVARRLRVDRLVHRYAIEFVDLNRVDGVAVPMRGGVAPRIARPVLDADFVMSVPTVKTHAEMVLSGACKNWIGVAVAQDKRLVHRDLAGNICALNQVAPPGLILVDGLVGMEGNGPGDGVPVRLERLVLGDDPWRVDLVLARLLDIPWRTIPYLARAHASGLISEADARVAAQVPRLRSVLRAPSRSPLAVLSEQRVLHPLKLAVRPLVERRAVAELAYRAGIVQDVYARGDDSVTRVVRDHTECGGCDRCVQVCPDELSRDEIGVVHDPERCLRCLYCWWVCPTDALRLEGDLGAMERQVARYRPLIREL